MNEELSQARYNCYKLVLDTLKLFCYNAVKRSSCLSVAKNNIALAM